MSDQRIGAAQFKEQCLQLLDQLSPEGLVITKRGKPIARVVPFERSGPTLIGVLKGKIRIRGDILSTDSRWGASERSVSTTTSWCMRSPMR